MSRAMDFWTQGLHLWAKQVGLPVPEREYRFHPTRKWRFDYCWPLQKVALEIEGGVFVRGRHSRGMGMLKDMEKYNHAAVLGWRVIRCQPKDVSSPKLIALLQEILG